MPCCAGRRGTDQQHQPCQRHRETQAAIALWQQVRQRDAHQDSPPLLSDGWGGQREAVVLRPHARLQRAWTTPARKQPGADWQYTHMVKQRDATGNLIGIDLRVIYGNETPRDRTGERTTCAERTHLTSRHMDGRLVRKTPVYSKRVDMLQAACAWQDVVYNFARPVNTLRCAINIHGKRWLQSSPAMAAGLTDHLWSIRELLMRLPLPTNSI